MTEIILVAVIAFLIIGTYLFLKKDKKELTEEEIIVPELDLPIETWSPEVIEEVKEAKAIGKTEIPTEAKKDQVKKKGRPKKSQ